MTDEFDAFLSEALAPQERPADRSFVARIQAEIVFDRDLAAMRRRALRKLATDLVVLAGLTLALLWVAQAPQASASLEETGAALTVVLGLFGLVATVVVIPPTLTPVRRIA